MILYERAALIPSCPTLFLEVFPADPGCSLPLFPSLHGKEMKVQRVLMATGIWAVCRTLFKRRGACRYFKKKEKDSLSLPSSRTAALTELLKRNLKRHMGSRSVLPNLGPQHLKGHGIIYAIITFFLVLTLINQILNNTLQSLSVFLSRMNQERKTHAGPQGITHICAPLC